MISTVEARAEIAPAHEASLRANTVRWIVSLKVAAHPYDALWRDPGLTVVTESDSIALFEVRSWAGPGVLADGTSIDVDSLVPSIVRPRSNEAFTWYRVGSKGWRRAGKSATVDRRGTLQVPAGSGVLWNVLVIPCVASQLIPFVALGLLGRMLIARRRRRTVSIDSESAQ